MSRISHLVREQVIPTDLDRAWEFISTPKNLDHSTPENLSFPIVSDIPAGIFDGLLIKYQISIPFLGGQTWLSEIQNIQERRSFFDVQHVGPYRYLHHYHEITEQPEDIRFFHLVTSALPLGPLGTLAHALYVKSKLKRIIAYPIMQ
ncbi:MAG: SRPBCC family protein [Planctomycetota bacterium]|nr:SRPBCC family protein [Planctomycetota bacterium]